MSNLHIYEGEECQMFILKEVGGKDRCHSTALWRPSLFPVSCVYADYGQADELNQLVFEPLILNLQKKLDEYDLGENQYHGIEVKRNNFNESLFFEAVHEGRLTVTEPVYPDSKEKLYIDFVLIKQSIIDRVFDSWPIELYAGEGQGNCGYKNSYLNVYLKDALAAVPDYITKVIIEYDSFVRNDNERMFYLKRENGKDHIISKILSSDTYRYFELFDFKEFIITCLKSSKIEQAEAVVKSYILGLFVDKFFESTRKIWVPACHEGSQNTESSGHLALANAVIDECKDDHDGDEE